MKKILTLATAGMLIWGLAACNKPREVSVDKVTNTLVEGVIAEQRDSGNVLTVDTVFLNKTEGDNFVGELRGHINDSTEVVYDLNVVDEGNELSGEWTLRE